MTSTALVPQVIGAMQRTTQALRNMVEILPTWDDEHLAEFFRNCAELQNGTYYAQCLVAHILFTRYQNLGAKEARRRVASLLHLSPFTVYEMVEVWDEIFRRMGVEDYVLPAGFYQQALRARSRGLDPVEAVRYAAHRRQVLGQNYRISDFSRDIRAGLPETEDSPGAETRTCRRCEHLRETPSGAKLLLVIGNGEITVLAEGKAEKTRYCTAKRLLSQDLIPHEKTAKDCPDYEERGGGK
ncbi:MAG: hypothetical protein NZ651_06215 [Candidatus Bipolaricaulota bacterium]|nr:hypothetical protein [Candidatus Bipolaricaulota bacterium]MDW8127348.1 hypothetical protein [Candidatus Bipolaricaulota bacterium]